MGLPTAKATWESVKEFLTTFLDFQLKDELFVNGGSDVMVGQVYQHRHKACDMAATMLSALSPQDENFYWFV